MALSWRFIVIQTDGSSWSKLAFNLPRCCMLDCAAREAPFHHVLLDQLKKLADEPYYSDIWSYLFDNEIWVRERLCGDYPCPREDMGVTYHPEVNADILFVAMIDICVVSHPIQSLEN